MKDDMKINPVSEVIQFFRTLITLLLFAFLIQATVVQAFKIPSSSMEPTLQIGDHLLIFKLQYGIRLPFFTETVINYSSPSRGDIVVFTRPDEADTVEDESDINIIKRVIGVEGDLLEVREATAFINGEALKEPYAQWLGGGVKDFGPITVPPGKIVLLGDNRDYSKDSRYWETPFLDVARVKGRAFIIYWSQGFYFDRMFKIIR